jgi:4-hydroxyphenylpyruvate dioxygenase
MENPLKLRKIHHVEFLVGNAKQAAFYYRNAFGFSQVAYRGLETGTRDRASYVVAQGKARFVLTTPLVANSELGRFLEAHGDGVRDIAFHVDDADHAFNEAVARGAEPCEAPHDVADETGVVRRASIKAYGDTIHSFVSHTDYGGPFLPGFAAAEVAGDPVGIAVIDHIVANVELGKMNHWADWYTKVFGFHRYITFDDQDISTEYSALMSIVMAEDTHTMKFPINEPAPGRRKSQIDEYLEWYGGAGVQHIALQCKDILHTVGKLRRNGVEFLNVPETYYDSLEERVGELKEPMAALREMRILVDRDDEGYLLQIFTKPLGDRPTIFFEIIERHGARGFGEGNFKALFEAIEREQAARGNL